MGRYAFFNTSVEYKFRFGIQDSEDIRKFGGVGSYEGYESGYSSHSWNQSDKETIEAELKRLLEWIGIDLVDFSTYEKNSKGTQQLYSDMYDLYHKDYNEEVIARYILGCLIYHQLLYTESLQADYEG